VATDCGYFGKPRLKLGGIETKAVSKQKLNAIGIQIARFLLIFLIGILIGVQLPSWLLRAHILPPYIPPRLEIEPFLLETNVEGLISIDGEADILDKRNKLIAHIWSTDRLPTELPDRVTENIVDVRYEDLENLKQISKITVNMDWGINSIAYHFVPAQSNRNLVIYHQGHYGDFIFGKDAIQELLNEGYNVIALSMPLFGLNNRPVVDVPRVGKLKFTGHEYLKFLPTENGYPVKYFLQPVAMMVNYAQQHGYSNIYMLGLSGGGWTTTLYAAIDPRIERSYPVAGSLPIFLRPSGNLDWGDYEETIPEFFAIANYPELYILGSSGEGRRQIQILNKYDPCCFAGIRYKTYEDIVKQRVQSVGAGYFAVYLDETNREHKISDQAIKIIIDDLKSSN